MTGSLLDDANVVRNYLEWKLAVHGGGSTLEAHRQLVVENRPMPAIDEALDAISRIVQALEWE